MSTKLPDNIDEFNVMAAMIFAQLYQSFPVTQAAIDKQAIAAAFDVRGEWSQHTLPSGRSFADILAHTIGWLSSQNYMLANGAHPGERVVLTDKGLAAMNAVPSSISATIGSSVVAATNRRDWGAAGDFVGGMFGGLIKSTTTP